jgi:hypothetical protein
MKSPAAKMFREWQHQLAVMHEAVGDLADMMERFDSDGPQQPRVGSCLEQIVAALEKDAPLTMPEVIAKTSHMATTVRKTVYGNRHRFVKDGMKWRLK